MPCHAAPASCSPMLLPAVSTPSEGGEQGEGFYSLQKQMLLIEPLSCMPSRGMEALPGVSERLPGPLALKMVGLGEGVAPHAYRIQQAAHSQAGGLILLEQRPLE